MKKKKWNVIALLMSGLFISRLFAVELPATGGEAASSQVQKSGSLNVRNFGAKGDGITDDSDAIQRTLLQAGTPEYSKIMSKLTNNQGTILCPDCLEKRLSQLHIINN